MQEWLYSSRWLGIRPIRSSSETCGALEKAPPAVDRDSHEISCSLQSAYFQPISFSLESVTAVETPSNSHRISFVAQTWQPRVEPRSIRLRSQVRARTTSILEREMLTFVQRRTTSFAIFCADGNGMKHDDSYCNQRCWILTIPPLCIKSFRSISPAEKGTRGW
jgi:hypothetical protein